MGMLDLNTKYSLAQAVTSTGDTASTNVYDAGSAESSDIGLNDELWFNVICSTTATSGGSATVQAVLQDSADNSTLPMPWSAPCCRLPASSRVRSCCRPARRWVCAATPASSIAWALRH